MKRGVVLGALLTVGALSLGLAASHQEEIVVEVEQLEDNLFVLRGGGGNSAVFVTSNGVVLVDTKVPGWGAAVDRQDSRADAEPGDHDHQYPHPL